MSTTVLTSYPNKIVAHPATPGTTAWKYIGINKTTRAIEFYDTLALLKAGNALTYPGLDGGGKIGSCLITTKTSAGADGSGCEFALNVATLPTGIATATNAVTSAGQQISEACPFRTIACALVAGGDYLVLDGAH